MVTTADFRNGLCVEFEGDLYTIVSFQHNKTARGGATVRTKFKSLTSGRTREHTFNAGEKIQDARIERRPYQFLYKDDMGYNFMHGETFEQVSLQEEMVENKDLLKDSQQVYIIFHAEDERILGCELPQFVELAVTYTEPGLRGDTASSTALKPATLETGAEIRVPLFINTGDRIRVDTVERAYGERIK